MYSEIIKSINYDPVLNSEIKKKTKKTFGICFIVALLLIFAFEILWLNICSNRLFLIILLIVTPVFVLALALLSSKCIIFLQQKLSVWQITNITHDYSLGSKRGTGGLTLFYTHIEETHALLLIGKSLNNNDEFEKDFTVPSQYYRVYREGDVIVHHPQLDYLANISNPSLCTCMKCGEMQDSKSTLCHNCSARLLNVFNSNYKNI